MNDREYVAPAIEVVALEPEKGFAMSSDTPISPWENENF